jgi:hypothetical protein
MKHGRLADFFFVGLGIVPVALALGGLPHLAMLLFLPLLFVACAYGMAEQLEDQANSNGGSGTDAPPGGAPQEGPGLTFTRRSPRE